MAVPRHTIAGAALAAVTLFGATGCVVSSSTRTVPIGTEIGQATLDQIEPGETSVGWLLAVLGDPDVIEPADADPLAGDPATMSWVGGRQSIGGGNVLIFGGSTASVDAIRTIFEVEDGVVREVRREGADRRLTDEEVDRLRHEARMRRETGDRTLGGRELALGGDPEGAGTAADDVRIVQIREN